MNGRIHNTDNSFYVFISSQDCKHFKDNTFSNFLIEFPKYLNLSDSNPSNPSPWQFAVTDLSIKNWAGSKLQQPIVLLCDLADHSYINGKEAGVLRTFPSAEESYASLYIPLYVRVNKTYFNKLRIKLTDRDLKPIILEEANSVVVQSTLHFMKET